MQLINTFADYEESVDLLTHEPRTSVFLNAYSSGMSFPDAINLYGEEMVSPVTAGTGQPLSLTFSISKAMLISDMAHFVVNNKPLFSAPSIDSLTSALKIACLYAENAVADKAEQTRPDPRYRTCIAGAQALASLASAYASDGPSGALSAKYAIASLLDLGIANHQNLDLNLHSNDTGIIGYSYLQELIRLASHPQTAPLVAAVFTEKMTKNQAAAPYIASVAFCSLVLEDASGHKKEYLRQIEPFFVDFNPGRPLYLLTEGMKIEKPDSRKAEMISTLLCGMVAHKDLQNASNQLVSWAKQHVQQESQTIHCQLVGNNLLQTGPLVVSAMERTLHQQNPVLSMVFQENAPTPPR